MASTHTRQNCNYRIGTDTLPDGKVRAQARGRKTSRRTFASGTTHEDAAAQLALKIEGPERFAYVEKASAGVTRLGHEATDWSVFVKTEV